MSSVSRPRRKISLNAQGEFNLTLDVLLGIIRYPESVNKWSANEMEVKMFSAHTRQINWLMLHTLSCWLVSPSPLIFTVKEYTGDPADEYSNQEADCAANNDQTPEIDADEFESVYQWFLS